MTSNEKVTTLTLVTDEFQISYNEDEEQFELTLPAHVASGIGEVQIVLPGSIVRKMAAVLPPESVH
jgi:hypothetical protein